MEELIKVIANSFNNIFVKLVIVAIMFDVVLGVSRSIKQRNVCSIIGIDGLTRKVTMILCVLFLIIVDSIANINLIGFIPNEVLDFIKIKKIGVSELFSILYIAFESLSILENMTLCGIPVPTKIKNKIEEFLNVMTNETKKKEG